MQVGVIQAQNRWTSLVRGTSVVRGFFAKNSSSQKPRTREALLYRLYWAARRSACQCQIPPNLYKYNMFMNYSLESPYLPGDTRLLCSLTNIRIEIRRNDVGWARPSNPLTIPGPVLDLISGPGYKYNVHKHRESAEWQAERRPVRVAR